MNRTLRRIRERLVKMLEEARQIIRDVEYWNSHRHEKMDCELERVLVSLLLPAIAALDRGDWPEFKRRNEAIQAWRRRVEAEVPP